MRPRGSCPWGQFKIPCVLDLQKLTVVGEAYTDLGNLLSRPTHDRRSLTRREPPAKVGLRVARRKLARFRQWRPLWHEVSPVPARQPRGPPFLRRVRRLAGTGVSGLRLLE